MGLKWQSSINKHAALLTVNKYFYISRYMELKAAVAILSALAQESRLGIFRLLIEQGDDGMPAGDIAARLKCPQNTLSAHLSILSRSGLIRSRRMGRSIIYAVDWSGTQKLFAYLLQDCCQGRADICLPLLTIGKTTKKAKS